MALVKRLSNLFTADVHAILDLVEDPLILLKQAIRDMQGEIERQKNTLQTIEFSIEQSASIRQTCLHDKERINQDIDLCFVSSDSLPEASEELVQDRTSLIRTLIKKRLKIEKQIRLLESTAETQKKHLHLLRSRIQQHQQQYDSMNQQAQQLLCQSKMEKQNSLLSTDFAIEISEDEIEMALLSEQHTRSQQ